jgi:hypothetical protein
MVPRFQKDDVWMPVPVPDPDPGFAGMTVLMALSTITRLPSVEMTIK